MQPSARKYPNLETKEPDFPNLTKIRELDAELHAERALAAGLTPEQAMKHTHEDIEDGERDAARRREARLD